VQVVRQDHRGIDRERMTVQFLAYGAPQKLNRPPGQDPPSFVYYDREKRRRAWAFDAAIRRQERGTISRSVRICTRRFRDRG
jgi:hypothetical protein